MTTEILDEVFEIIKDRLKNPKEGSYVSSLMEEGEEKILEKIEEEAGELEAATRSKERDGIVHEAADLIFHVMMLLGKKGVEFDEVMEELRRRRRPR